MLEEHFYIICGLDHLLNDSLATTKAWNNTYRRLLAHTVLIAQLHTSHESNKHVWTESETNNMLGERLNLKPRRGGRALRSEISVEVDMVVKVGDSGVGAERDRNSTIWELDDEEGDASLSKEGGRCQCKGSVVTGVGMDDDDSIGLDKGTADGNTGTHGRPHRPTGLPVQSPSIAAVICYVGPIFGTGIGSSVVDGRPLQVGISSMAWKQQTPYPRNDADAFSSARVVADMGHPNAANSSLTQPCHVCAIWPTEHGFRRIKLARGTMTQAWILILLQGYIARIVCIKTRTARSCTGIIVYASACWFFRRWTGTSLYGTSRVALDSGSENYVAVLGVTIYATRWCGIPWRWFERDSGVISQTFRNFTLHHL
ncbi:hypothetical protein EV421DRAFT_1739963 [Armillaria borealis]|uniref:Uncharacterized protein n=1 Tax=Armillaria borealis TaxID=47425 RepID=A0AA39J4G7_9AGAR|nr:hypothetical protein EV421DRAFT_1739963 [Armillaria borealis]